MTAADGMSTSRAAALGWVGRQQDSAQGFRVALDAPYGPGHNGAVSGTIEGAAELPGVRTPTPWVAFAEPYSDEYVGPVAGSFGNLPDANEYRVNMFSRPRDPNEGEYFQGSYPVQAGGVWSSEDQIARAGAKIAYLTRVSSGARIAVTGGGRQVIAGVEVRVFVRTDVDYEQARSTVDATGAWMAPWVKVPVGGTLIARLYNTDTNRVLNSTEWSGSSGYNGLVRSFGIPFDDPDFGYEGGIDQRTGYRLEQRTWIYDDAVAVYAWSAAGQHARSRAVLAQLAALQNPDGSLRFSYDTFRGEVFEEYIRAGSLAWVGAAALVYEETSGDATFRPFATRIADYLMSLQVSAANGFATDDARYGSVLGGIGSYASDYTFTPNRITWASTEHNIDAYFFLRDLGYVSGSPRYVQAAGLVKTSLLANHWNSAQGRFNQGVGDAADALDLASWGGLFLLAVGEDAKAAQAASWMERFKINNATIARSTEPNTYNQTYSSPGPISGYRPYLDGYVDPPAIVWAEGSWGAILFKLRRGEDVTADLQSMQRMQAADPDGGFVQVTKGHKALPYEFHVWPSVGGTGWAALVARNPGLLWKRDNWIADEPSGSAYAALGAAGTSAGGGNPSTSAACTPCPVADPVNTATGEFWETVTDLTVPGRKPIAAARTYSSLTANKPGMFGTGWSSPWEASVSAGPATTVTQENGSQVTFTQLNSGVFEAPASVRATLSRDATTGAYTFTRRGGNVMTFNSDGRLGSTKDRNGETTTLTWTASALTVSASDGRALTFALDGAGRAQSLTGPQGRVVTYRYTAGRLEQVTDVRGQIWSYGYDAASGRTTSMTTPLQERTTNEYDQAGRVTRQIGRRADVHTFSYSTTGPATTTRVTDPTGVITDYAYTYGLLASRTVDPTGTSSTWTFLYDTAGNRTSTVDPTGVRTSTTYDGNGNPLVHTDGAGNQTRLTHNAWGQPLTSTNPAGQVSTYDYDLAGNLEKMAAPRTASVQAVTRFTRDPAHPADVLSVTDADGRVSTQTYTAQGFVASKTSGVAAKESFTYDAYGALLTRTAPNGNAPGAAAGSFTTTTVSDAGGLLTSSTNALGHTTTHDYDANGRRIRTTDPDLKVWSTAYWPDGNIKSTTDPVGRTNSFTYDLAGRDLTRTSPNGAVTSRTYDRHGQLKTLTQPSGNAPGLSAAQQAARTVTFSYDAAHRPTGSSQPDPATPGGTLTHRTSYDTAGRPWKSTTPDDRTTTTRYSLDRVDAITDPAGNTTTFGYDLAGNQVSTSDPLGDTSTVSYTAAGLVATTADALGNTTSFTYDGSGRPATRTDPRGTCAGCTPAHFTSTAGYDLNGNPVTSADQLGRVTSNVYDAADRLVRVTDPKDRSTRYSYDKTGRLASVTAPDLGTTSYGYNDAGDLTSTTSPRGNHTTIAYDAAGRPDSSTDQLGRTRSRTYTPDGQVATEVTARGHASQTPDSGTISLSYDELGRRVGITYGDGAAPVSFSYDKASRLASMSDAAGTQTYGYDANGRTTTIARGAGSWQYSYYNDGQLKTTTRPDSSSETFTYDAAGRITTAVTPVGTTSYAWDANGNLLTSALPNATVETQTWDRTSRLAEVSTMRNAAPLVAQTITRDETYNPRQITVARGAGTETRSFTYDGNDRLQGVCYTALACTDVSAAEQWWTYDQDGNRATEKNGTGTGTTTSYTYDSAGQLTTSKTGTAPALTSTYDADGNQLSNGASSTTYDLSNRPKTSTNNGALTSWLRDGQGNPLTSTTGELATTYGWDLRATIPRLATKNSGSSDSLRYDPLGRASTLTTGSTHTTFAHDPLGAPTDQIASTGTISRSTDWTPFGASRAAIGAPTSPTGPDSPLGYAGMTLGPDNSYLTRDRHYTPKTGRWTATDPIYMSAGTAFDSPYSYVGNRPGLFVDPLGQLGCEWTLQCGGALDDIGQAGLGVMDAGIAMGKGAVAAVGHPIGTVQAIAATAGQAYYQDGLLASLNTVNPAYAALQAYDNMIAAVNAGCLRQAGNYAFQGNMAVAQTVTVGASGAALARSAGTRGLTSVADAPEGRFGLAARARMGRSLNPEAGTIGGGGFTGRATGHGAERIAEAGFDDIDAALIRAGTKYEQSDGAFAYVAQAGRDSYNMIIQNADGAVVTAHRGMSFSDLGGLARNYGWSGW